MKKQIAEEWVALLESGMIEQGTHRLEDDEGKCCCLGVLCNMAFEQGEADRVVSKAFEGVYFNDEMVLLPSNVMNWAGMKTSRGLIQLTNKSSTNLAFLNDSGKSFEEIAKIIRKHWRQL